MESEQHPSSSLLSHQHDFSSLVSWPYHWQPESFEITTNHIPTSPPGSNNPMTQVVPEHVARAKLGSGGNSNIQKENNSIQKTRPQRSNSATLSTISVTCDTDTSIRSRNTRHQQSPSTKGVTSNKNTKNDIAASHSSSALIHVSVNPSPTTSFRNHYQSESSGKSSSSIPTSLTTTSGMNIIHEKSTMSLSASTASIPNKHSIKTGGGGGEGAVGGTAIPTKSFSHRQKTESLDDSHHRTTQTRGIGKSVLEHLVFVFPENVRRMLTGPKK
jgi:hypothetical protein